MSITMKIGLLALASTVVAHAHHGANPHNRYHAVKRGGYEEKPYPSGGWGKSNTTTTVPAQPVNPGNTGYPGTDETTTVDVTSTSTTTLYTTVVVKPSASTTSVEKENVPSGTTNDKCGPPTVTVTVPYPEKVTVTVSASNSGGYPVNTPKPEKSTSTAGYPVNTPEPSKSSSSAQGYAISSTVENKPSQSSPSPSASALPPSGNTYTGTKRGLAYNEASLCKTLGSNFGFGYNWGQVENSDIGTQFIPMMHGPDKSTVEEWLANVDKAVKKGSKAVMGFNECDQPSQCNMSPQDACTAWKSYMNPVKSAHPDVTIIGPSVSNGPSPMGLGWLSSFHDSCPDAIVDATNIHFYDIYQEGQTLERFKAQVEKAAALYGKKVFVTEFGLNPGSATSEQAVEFLKGAMEYLDNSDDCQGYSWFMVGTGENQLNSGSGLSPIGQVYAGSY